MFNINEMQSAAQDYEIVWIFLLTLVFLFIGCLAMLWLGIHDGAFDDLDEFEITEEEEKK